MSYKEKFELFSTTYIFKPVNEINGLPILIECHQHIHAYTLCYDRIDLSVVGYSLKARSTHLLIPTARGYL